MGHAGRCSRDQVLQWVANQDRRVQQPPETRWVPLVTGAGSRAHRPGAGRKASKESNAGAANAAGGVAPAEDFHARLISAQRRGGGGSHAKAISLDRKGSSKRSPFPGSPRGKELGVGMRV